MASRFSFFSRLLWAALAFGLGWAPLTGRAQFYWDNGGTAAVQNVWRNKAVPAGNAAANWQGNVAPSSGATIVFGDTYVSQNQTIDLQGEDKAIGSLYLTGRYNYTVNASGGNKLIFDSLLGTSYLLDTSTSSGNNVINAGVQLANDLMVYNYDNRTLRFGGLVDTKGSNTLTVTGPGDTDFAGGITGGGNVTKMDAGVMEFESTVSLGTLNLAGGTLLLNNAAVTATTLHVTGNSILDFGNGLASIINVSNLIIDAGATLTLNHWTSALDYFYDQSNPSAANLNRITFNGFGAAAWQSFDRQVRPVPEAGLYGAILLCFVVGLVFLRRFTPAARDRCESSPR